MKSYIDLLKDILSKGEERNDRTGVGVKSIFGYQINIDLKEGFPLLTTKKVHFKSIVYELLWFLRGDTNIGYLNDNGVSIWDEWADKKGDLGPIYGHQWRSWTDGSKGIDQISQLIDTLKRDPTSRRLIVSSWNVADIKKMALPPCHVMFQFYVSNRGLCCHLYQRSADVFLGVPFNIASYSLFTIMVAKVIGLPVYKFVHSFGDVHIYNNHIEKAELQISRQPKELPKLEILGNIKSIFDFKYENFKLIDYRPHPHIKASVAV